MLTKDEYVKWFTAKNPLFSEEDAAAIYDDNLPHMIAEDMKRVQDEQMRTAVFVLIQAQAVTLNDEQVAGMSTLFDEWSVGSDYKAGHIVRYKGGLYRISQDIKGAQADHTPDKAVSLYKKIGEPTGGLFPWSQPQGAHDAYKKDDKVSHKGKTWVSTVDANVWEPGVYGWEEAKE